MQYEGHLSKMKSRFGDPISYSLQLGDDTVELNPLLGKQVKIYFTGDIHCKKCGRALKKTFSQGFCFPCFQSAPEASPCIIRPELCEAHLGKGRDLDWENEHHMKPHTVYLAVSSGLKIGVTRMDQVPTRWIDQGAWQAIRLADVPYRQIAGVIEKTVARHISDKTSWQKMLKNQLDLEHDLVEEKHTVKKMIPEAWQEYVSTDDKVWELKFPVLEYPEKIKSVNLLKIPLIEGKLMGVKGQYLMLDEGRVLNIRSHTSFRISLEVIES